MFRKKILIIIVSSVCVTSAWGQQTDSALLYNDPYIAELDSLLNEPGSSDFLKLIDSLINLPAPAIKSQMIVRLGYNSNVVSASRTIGLNQFGMAPGISYYHKSGFYADATGYWSEEYEPNYYLTVGSVGYMNSPTKWWSFMTEYSRYMYSRLNEDDYIAYKNNVGVSNFFDVGLFTFRLDYQFYFGDKTAHRISPSIMLNLYKTNVGIFDRVAFYPMCSVLFGNEQWTKNTPYPLALTRLGFLYLWRNNLPRYYTETFNKFGVLNYSFVAPLAVTVKQWTFLVSYTYNIPKSLSGEPIELVNAGYISASISKRVKF